MNLRHIIISALCAAFIVIGSYISFAIGPVPITMQTAFVLLAGILAGKGVASTAVAIYIALGAIGVPVFSAGSGGFAHLTGPTGGFLISYLVAGPVTGFLADRGFRNEREFQQTTKKQLWWIVLAAVVGTLIFFIIGVPYLKMILTVSWTQALVIGVLPFIAGDLLKLLVVVILGNMFAPSVRSFIASEVVDEKPNDS
ncbi:MAG: biotin transporter BioY [Sphaerochaetaceae bacterium]|jgi:biotin transport system substrate-specific component